MLDFVLDLELERVPRLIEREDTDDFRVEDIDTFDLEGILQYNDYIVILQKKLHSNALQNKSKASLLN